ncbi:phospholipid phosphatase-related protein type 5 isoform X6 [Nothobranchius furzeri]|uniref:phospholipid phosphatase-related protein type 5 isoform X6 n=1 Tax=Nothobranchius furzeri TaxID=105023 RepID=UPI00077D1FD3
MDGQNLSFDTRLPPENFLNGHFIACTDQLASRGEMVDTSWALKPLWPQDDPILKPPEGFVSVQIGFSVDDLVSLQVQHPAVSGMILNPFDPKAFQHLSQGFDSVPELRALSCARVISLSGVGRLCFGLMGETSFSKISEGHRASVASTAKILQGSVIPPDPGGADADRDAPPMTPHPVTGRVDGGTRTPADAQYSEEGSLPTEGGADALTDLTPLQQALMTSKLQGGETPTKRGVRCCPVNLLVDPDLSERAHVSTWDLPGSTSAPDPPLSNSTVWIWVPSGCHIQGTTRYLDVHPSLVGPASSVWWRWDFF